jgi:hypothetical protein
MGVLPTESADQGIWKPLRGKLAQVSGKFFSGKKAAGRAGSLAEQSGSDIHRFADIVEASRDDTEQEGLDRMS